jgi:hypothetical protein
MLFFNRKDGLCDLCDYVFQVGLRGLTEPVDLLRDHCSGRITPCCESNHYFIIIIISTVKLFNFY